MAVRMTKQLRTFHFDPEIYDKFKATAKSSVLMAMEVFDKFMCTCAELGAVKFSKSIASMRDAQTEARVLLTWLRRGSNCIT